MEETRVFLLSPANVGGVRAKLLLRPNAGFELARRLQREGAELGELFSFVSGLYFRGKLTYARRFGNAPAGVPSLHVITADRGLQPPDLIVSVSDFQAMAGAPIDEKNRAYVEPLLRDARLLAADVGKVVLLGSLATGKYVSPLSEVFGDTLMVPEDFPGRGDMSRGALLLRAAQEGRELSYIAAAIVARRRRQTPLLR